MTRPVKEELPQYRLIEEPLQDTIWLKYLGTPLTVEENRQVFQIDDDVLWHEFVNLMGAALSNNEPALATVPEYSFTGFDTCREEYLELFNQLIG